MAKFRRHLLRTSSAKTLKVASWSWRDEVVCHASLLHTLLTSICHQQGECQVLQRIEDDIDPAQCGRIRSIKLLLCMRRAEYLRHDGGVHVRPEPQIRMS